jgi:hypothetical protein
MCIGFFYYYPRQLIADEISLTCGFGTASTPTSSPPNSTSASSILTTSNNIVILSLCGAILWSSSFLYIIDTRCSLFLMRFYFSSRVSGNCSCKTTELWRYKNRLLSKVWSFWISHRSNIRPMNRIGWPSSILSVP